MGSRLQGKDCSYNPFAFPQVAPGVLPPATLVPPCTSSLEVRCRRYEPCDPHGRGEIEQRRSSCRDGRRYESKDGRGRATQETKPRSGYREHYRTATRFTLEPLRVCQRPSMVAALRAHRVRPILFQTKLSLGTSYASLRSHTAFPKRALLVLVTQFPLILELINI